MTEKGLLIKCIDHYEYCLNEYSLEEDYCFLEDEDVDRGICSFIDSIGQSIPSWIGDTGLYWYSHPELSNDTYDNINCLSIRIKRMKDILLTFVEPVKQLEEDVYTPVFNPNQLTLF